MIYHIHGDTLSILVHPTSMETIWKSSMVPIWKTKKVGGCQSYGVPYPRGPLPLQNQVTETVSREPYLYSHGTFFLCVHLLLWAFGSLVCSEEVFGFG